MTATYDCIATTTLTTSTADVTFSSIPGTYTDLVLVAFFQQSIEGENSAIQVNSDTGSNYSRTIVSGDGSSTYSNRQTSQTRYAIDFYGSAPTSTSFAVATCNFMNYANTTTYKTIISRQGSSGGSYPGTIASVGLWRSTSAITSIKFFCTNSSNMKSGTTITLYGIKAE